MEKKALMVIVFIVIVALLMNNAPQKTTQQKKLRAQTTATVNFPDTDTINGSASYDDYDDAVNMPRATSPGFIQKLKRAIVDLPVPRFVGPSIPKETQFDPCATNKKSPIKHLQPRLPFSPPVQNR